LFNINISLSQDNLYPNNLNFEDGKPGELPIGWVEPGFSIKNEYKAFITKDEPKSGKKCLELNRLEKPFNDSIVGAVMQSIDAKPYRGKRIRFRAAVCAEIISNKGSAHLWLRVQKADKCDGLTDYKENEPVVNTDWKYCEIVGRIDEDAETINYGMLLSGNGRAWIDDASFEIIDVNIPSTEPASPLNEIGLDNIKAFIKLVGYIRYFYPGSELQNINWNKLIYNGIKTIENKPDSETLIESLKKIFVPIAPGIKISKISNAIEDCGFKTAPSEAMKNVAMVRRHIGPEVQTNYQLVKNELINMYNSQREREANVFQVLDATPFLGKKIKFSAMVKADVIKPAGQAQLGIKIDLPQKTNYSNEIMYNNPIIKNTREKYTIESNVPKNAENIYLGLILVGDGEAWFDDLKLTVIDRDNKEIDYNLRNSGFEESDTGKIVKAWSLPNSAINAGYNSEVTNIEKFSGEKSLRLFSEEISRISFPEVGESYTSDLNDKIKFCMPLTSFADTLQTLPHISDNIKKENLNDSLTFIFNGNDRTSRIAIISTLWNIYKHFGLYDNPDLNWDELLSKYLNKAATNKNNEEFIETIKYFLIDVNDDQASVWQNELPGKYILPFGWKYIEDKLVITYVADSTTNIKKGDVVLDIDGKPVNRLIDEKVKSITGVSKELKKLKAAVMLKTGENLSNVNLKIQSSDGTIYNKDFKRDFLITDLYEPKPPVVYEVKPGIFYVDLTRLGNQNLKKIIKKFENSKGVIFDLRGLTGVSDFFLGMWASGYMKSVEMRLPVFTKPDHKMVSYKTYPNVISPKNPYLKSKIAFLSDERTTAVSEIILAVVKHYALGEIVGTSTAGMLTDVIGFNISNDYHFAMSGVIGIAPDGDMINKKVITPTIEVHQTIKGIIEGKDEVLEKAIEVLEKQIN
jgi:C-terminal processing protease CtpA/Prc